MTELRARLAKAFPESQIDRGFLEQEVSTYDHFYIMDLPEQAELSDKGRGMYICTFTASISYWVQTSKDNMIPLGNTLLEKVRLAIETDESFDKLAIRYAYEEGAILWYDEGVLDVELTYTFEYTKSAGWVRSPLFMQR